MNSSMVSRDLIAKSSWLLLEGYLLANGDDTRAAVRTAVKYAKESGCKLGLSLSEAWVVQSQSEIVRELLEAVGFSFYE